MELLIVHDSQFNIKNEVVSRRHSWNVTLIGSGARAISAMTGHKNIYDVVVVDMQVQDLDGFKFRRVMSERKIRTPVVFFSLPFRAIESEVVRLGVVDILPKPVDIDKLIKSVEKAFYESKVFWLKEEYLAPLAKLYFRLNDRDFCKLLCGDEYLVGRGDDCDITIRLSKVSRKHFKLSRDYKLNQYLLLDLSMNGVEVNGVKVTSYQRLRHEDVISIPGCNFKLCYLNVANDDLNKTQTGRDE